jgi:hypothetical protein
MKQFDILLVFHFGRDDLYYLNIIKALSSKYKIGVVLSDDESFYDKPVNSALKKLRKTEKKIRNLCIELGAQKVYINERCSCNLLLMPLYDDYATDYLDKFKTNITSKKLIGVFNWARSTKGIELLKEWSADKYFCADKSLLNSNSKDDGTFSQIKDLKVIETGLPYLKYPVFEDSEFDIDYLIAMPSIINFRAGKNLELYNFYKTLLQMTKKINVNDKVYIKNHNVRDKQKFYYSNIGGNIVLRKLGICISVLLAKMSPLALIRNKFYSIASHFVHSQIEENFPSLEELTDYSNLGIEIFLPHVRKGVFTGLSGTVYHALHNKLPVYNCDNQKFKEDRALYNIVQIPFCDGALSFDESFFDRVGDNIRSSDMLELIEEELTKL